LGRKEEIPVSQEGNRLRSVEGLKDCREDSQGISNCQLGKETEMRSAEDLMDCQEDNEETLHCQLGNERRSDEDLKDEDLEDCQEGSESIKDCQEGSGGMLNCQVGRDEQLRPSEGLMENSIQQRVLMKMGSVDLMICQGSSSGSIPYCQGGRDEQMNLDQPEELTEQRRLSDSLTNSEVNLDQQMQLTEEEEHQDDILMIGGIEVSLPFAQEEAEISVVDGATAEEQSQLKMTVRKEEKLEQVFETAQTDERKNECSEEQLNNFSQQAERAVALKLTAEEEAEDEEDEHSVECLNDFSQEAERTAAFELTAKETGGDNEHSEEWLKAFSVEAEDTATWEFAATDEEGADNICFADLWDQIGALEERVRVQGRHIQQVRLETDQEGTGDHSDLPDGQKFLQLRRLQQQNQPLEQLDEVIMEIMELMLKSADTASRSS
jgi:hypothetical protein